MMPTMARGTAPSSMRDASDLRGRRAADGAADSWTISSKSGSKRYPRRATVLMYGAAMGALGLRSVTEVRQWVSSSSHEVTENRGVTRGDQD